MNMRYLLLFPSSYWSTTTYANHTYKKKYKKRKASPLTEITGVDMKAKHTLKGKEQIFPKPFKTRNVMLQILVF